MKILAIGRNYADHIKELHNERSEEPVIFTKPDTALLKNNDPFYYPDFSNDIHHELEVIIRICREGKHIEEEHAHKYYDKVGLGIDFTARDLQSKAKEKVYHGPSPKASMDLPLFQSGKKSKILLTSTILILA